MNNEQYIPEEALTELGIDVSGKDKEALLAQLNETLEERIGVEITDSLDDAQVQQLLDIQESGNDEALTKFLEENVPELEQIVSDNVTILLGELAENADTINDAE